MRKRQTDSQSRDVATAGFPRGLPVNKRGFTARFFYFPLLHRRSFVMNTRFPRYAGLLAVLLAAAPAVAPAQLYQYTDKSGNTVYTDHPPQNRESKQKRLREDGVYLSGESTVRPPASRSGSSDSQKPADEPKKKNYSRVSVAMYMTDW
jgi:hypothetical protein